MKKIFTLAILLVFASFYASSQSLKLILEDGTELSANDSLEVLLQQQAQEIETYIGYKNLTNSDLTFKVKKEILSMDENSTDITFCIGECYTGNLSSEVFVGANETVLSTNVNAFHSTYAGEGKAARVKYTFYNVENENDFVTVTIKYVEGVGINNIEASKTLHAYPNPAANSVNISYATTASDPYIVIKNLAGKEVYRTKVSGSTGKKQIDISGFAAGVYLYGLESSGKMLCTKKLLVK